MATVLEAARTGEGRIVALYLDEVTFYRQPTVAQAYAAQGHEQPLAERSCRSNTATRVIAALNACTGQTTYRRRSKLTLRELVGFHQQLRATYPTADRLYVIEDNWPEHCHPDVLAALEPQEQPFPWHRPANWPTRARPEAVRRWGDWQLPIQLVSLPTYASWTNPIEKLWRWLRQQVLHLHRLADDLPGLRRQVDRFLDRFAEGSSELLRYVGLLVPD